MCWWKNRTTVTFCAATKGSLPDTRGQVSGRSHIVPPLSFGTRLARLPSRERAPETELTVDWWTCGGTAPVKQVRTGDWEEGRDQQAVKGGSCPRPHLPSGDFSEFSWRGDPVLVERRPTVAAKFI